MFNWKFLNVWIANNIVERHYKCQNTGAYRCKEYKLGKSYKTVTYCLPNSEDYNIESEEALAKNIKNGECRQSLKEPVNRLD